MKKGGLLINLGTPDSPSVPDVRRYLKQFLLDPRVIDMRQPARYFLVNFLIVPKRSVNSARLYSHIWTERGSPLLFHSMDLLDKVRRRLGNEWQVELGMRYGSPSIPEAVAKLLSSGMKEIHVLPLYPQYASSSTETALDEVRRAVKGKKDVSIRFIRAFFDDEGFLSCFARNAKAFDLKAYDHFLFSYHGLPERHIHKSAAELGLQHCRIDSCCDSLHEGNRLCYRASCFETTRRLVAMLGLKEGSYSNAFQSRLDEGWLRPFSDKVLKELAAKGARKVLVFSPAFVADCLETLYEIQVEYDEIFREAGGEKAEMVPSLNSDDNWADTVCRLLTRI